MCVKLETMDGFVLVGAITVDLEHNPSIKWELGKQRSCYHLSGKGLFLIACQVLHSRA